MSTCRNPNGVSYFRFPKDPDLLKLWITKCKRQDNINIKNARMCELHFAQDCFERDLRSELLGLNPKKLLKKTSVPTLLLPNQKDLRPPMRESNARHAKRQKQAKAMIVDRTDDNPTSHAPRRGTSPAKDVAVQCNPPVKDQAIQGGCDAVDKASQCNTLYESQLRAKVKRLDLSLKNEKMKVSSLRKEIKRLNSKKHREAMVKDTLEKYQTGAQVRQSLNRKSKFVRGFTNEDIARALTIRSMSSRTFEYLRKNKLLALPCRQTLEKFIQHLNCEPGMLCSSIDILTKKMEATTSSHEKLSVLCIGQMEVRKCSEWCPKQKRTFGPHKKLLIGQVRGLTDSWNQPVYVNLDITMSKNLVDEIISKLEMSGLQILALVFDLENSKLISELGLTSERYSFANPAAPERQVFAFPNVPHLLKLFRNHLLDHRCEFQDSQGNYFPLGKKDLESVLAKTSSTDFKLSSKLIHCQGSARHKVRTAAQLLSLTTSKALANIGGETFLVQAEAIRTVNDWFDVMNSNKAHDPKKLSCALGMNYEDQVQALDRMQRLVETMKNCTVSSQLPFQSGILISIKSVKALFEEMKSFGLNFLFTTHVNQDCLETLFSQLRASKGSNQHPSPLECLQRLRILMFGKSHDIDLPNLPVEEESYEDSSTERECVSKLATHDTAGDASNRRDEPDAQETRT